MIGTNTAKSSGMRATRIEVRTRAPRAGRTTEAGKWEPAGQLVATVWVEQPGAVEEVVRRLSRDPEGTLDERWTVEVTGRQDTE